MMAKFNDVFTSERHDWETPDSIFIPLNKRFNFSLDVCASKENARCENYFTEEDDGLSKHWYGVCWMNPPFGDKKKWVKKAYEESLKDDCTVICLIPARTNTNWWHDYCMKGKIYFIKGRPKFKGAKYGLPQPLAIVCFGDGFNGNYGSFELE